MGLWTIVVDSFPVEQDNRDGRVGPASDLGDGRWQDSGYIEYLANRTEPPYRSPDCCVVEEPPTVQPPAFEDLSLPVQWLCMWRGLPLRPTRRCPRKLGFQYAMQWAEDAYSNFPVEIASKLNTAWYEKALTEYQKMESLEAIPKYSPKDKDDDSEMHLDIGRMFT